MEYKGCTTPEQRSEFVRSHFCASDGALVKKGNEVFRIVTIVPQQRENGHCVFLENDRCTIHEVSPYGCAYFSPHEPPEESERKSKAGLVEICRSPEYQIVYDWLLSQGVTARPLMERHEKKHQLFAEIENRNLDPLLHAGYN